MKFTLDASSRVNLIRAYAAGEIRIGEQVVRTNCIVTADTLITDWEPATVDDLTPAHLEPIFALNPQLVLLGTGPVQHFPPGPIRSEFVRRRMGLETMDLGAACRTFNILVQEERPVAAALFLR